MTRYLAILSFCVALSFECVAQNGYAELDSLFIGLADAIRSDDDSKLVEFCRKIVPDESTVAFMKKVCFNYQGFPAKFQGDIRVKLSEALVENLQIYIGFRERLRGLGLAADLVYHKQDLGERYWSETFGIKSTKEQAIHFYSNGKKIRIGSGRLFKINGAWKIFSQPTVNYIID